MKFIISMAFAFSALSIQAQNNIDVLHYKFAIELNDNNDSIFCEAEITALAKKGSNNIVIDLAGDMFGKKKGMTVTGAYLPYGKPGRKENSNPFIHKDNKLIIDTWIELTKDDTIVARIKYKGIPSDGLIISKTKYGQRSFFADNWPNRGHNWLPCNDDPADKSTVEFIVTAPEHYQVVSNGIQIEETNLSSNKKRTHWREDVPISTKVMVIGVAEFAVSLSGTINNCIPVYSWVYPENSDKGFYDYAQAAEILPWFINNIGPYAYKKLANVQSKTTFGGLENANTIFYSEGSVNGSRKSESLLVHEIAHQWFGNYATEKSFAHLWLSEGFATYMTIMYLENKYGQDTAIAMLKEDREQAINFGKRSPLPVVNNTTNYMELLNANSYQKGGWVLHMLRRELGDSIFWKGIQSYYSTYGGSVADTDDLRKIFENVSGKDLQQFFQQWLFTAENPHLEISWKYLAKEKKVAITVAQLQSTLFELPLEILLITELRKNNSEKIIVSKKKETYYFSTKEKISEIKADVNTSLLADFTVHAEK